VCISSVNETSCDSTWFYKEDCRLDDFVFGEKEGNKFTAKPLKDVLVNNARFDGYSERGLKGCDQVLNNLGLRCDHKMMRRRLGQICAFNFNDTRFNISNFIQDQILNPHEISALDDILNLRNRCEEINDELTGYQRQRDALEKVIKAFEDYSVLDAHLKADKLLKLYQEYKNKEALLEDKTVSLNAAKSQLEKDRHREEALRTDKNTAWRQWDDAKKNSGVENIYKQIEGYEANITQVEQAIIKAEREKKQLEYLVAILTGELKWLLDETEGTDIADRIRLCLNSDEDMSDITAKAFLEVEKERRASLQQQHELMAEKRNQQKSLEDDQTAISNKIRRLNKNGIAIPEDVADVCLQIRTELYKRGINTDVKTLAQHVEDITDASWRDSIEAYLGPRRYHIIVDPAYVGEAMKIKYEQDKSRNPAIAKKFRETTIAITDKVPSVPKIKEGSAAELLIIHNQTARNYANYLLNDIRLCSTLEELHDNPKGAIMRDGHVAGAYSFGNIRGYGKVEYSLGLNAMQEQMIKYEAEQRRLKAEWNDVVKDISDMRLKSEALEKLDLNLDHYNLKAAFEHRQHILSKENLCAMLTELKNRPDFITAQNAIKKYEDAYNKADKALSECSRKIGSSEELIRQLDQEIEEAKVDSARLKNEFDKRSKEWPEIAAITEAQYKDRIKRGYRNPISEERIREQETKLNDSREFLSDQQSAIIAAYPMYLGCIGTDPKINQRFQNDYNEIVNVKFEESKAKLAKYRKDMHNIFRNDFIEKLGKGMEEGERMIRSMNTMLKAMPFAGDTYEFKMERLPDRKPIFDEIARIKDPTYQIMAGYDDKPNEELDAMIDQMVSDVLRDEDCKDDYADYRKYFKYSMIIHRVEGEESVDYDFEEKMRSGSNGEKETPAFIMLIASYVQCIPNKMTCVRLLPIDEAFCHMDPDRIAQMVKYLDNNLLQAIYFAPPQTLNYIGIHTDSCSTTVRPGNAIYARIYDVTKEELKEWMRE
jgi:chromosome segregation ATPase